MADRYADFANLAAGQDVIGVIRGLRRQIEGDGQSGLALGQVAAIQLVRFLCRRVPGICAEDPGPIRRMLVFSICHGVLQGLLRRNMLEDDRARKGPQREAGACIIA